MGASGVGAGAASGAGAGVFGGPAGMVIGAGIGAGASIFGAKKQSNSAKRAQDIESKSTDAAMQFEREREAEKNRQWDIEQGNQKAQWEAQEEERLYTRRLAEEREARRAPYRAASEAALGRLGDMLGLPMSRPAMPATSGPPAGALPPGMPVAGARPMPMDSSQPGMYAGPATSASYAPVNPMSLGAFLPRPPQAARI